MRARKLIKLAYQFGHMAPSMDEYEIAEALSDAGMILVIMDDPYNKYVETDKMRQLPKHEFIPTIRRILKERANGRT